MIVSEFQLDISPQPISPHNSNYILYFYVIPEDFEDLSRRQGGRETEPEFDTRTET